jgi:hypothetical protein
MKRILIFFKESLQYVGIIIFACISALWLAITGKQHH